MQKKINMNSNQASETKNELNEISKIKNNNSTFIKKIQNVGDEKFGYSAIKNQNATSNFLQNPLNEINEFAIPSNINNYNTTTHLQKLNFNSKEKFNLRYSLKINNNDNNNSNINKTSNFFENKNTNQKRAKSGLATSLSNLEIFKKNQESKTTLKPSSNNFVHNNENYLSTSSNKNNIQLDHNYSNKKNYVNKINPNTSVNIIQNSQNNGEPDNFTNNNVYKNYSNFYLRYKNLTRPTNNSKLFNCNYTNVNTSNNYLDHTNNHSYLNNSVFNKTEIMNSSFANNKQVKPIILNDNLKSNNELNGNRSKNKRFLNLKTSDMIAKKNDFHQANNHSNYEMQKNFRNVILDYKNENTDKEINNNGIKNLNMYKKVENFNGLNKKELFEKNPKLSSMNIKNNPLIMNYHSKTKIKNNNAFIYNENLVEKINKGIHTKKSKGIEEPFKKDIISIIF